jgi:hypothetical protein
MPRGMILFAALLLAGCIPTPDRNPPPPKSGMANRHAAFTEDRLFRLSSGRTSGVEGTATLPLG